VIGVFDSGIGGLSVLRALIAELPHEDFVYFADTAHAPYGERDDNYVIERCIEIASFLVKEHAVKALVVACNTATAAAIDLLRHNHPKLPIVGVEPALKPAATLTRTGRIGVLATQGTLTSGKFRTLHDSLRGQAEFVLQPCAGLAEAIERDDKGAIERLGLTFLTALGDLGDSPGQIDTVVLGCTHYPFARHVLQTIAGDQVRLVETGEPVARQARRLLESARLLQSPTALAPTQRLITSGSQQALDAAIARILHVRCDDGQRQPSPR
jgi:glutamate racemase